MPEDLVRRFIRELELVGGRAFPVASWEELPAKIGEICSRHQVRRVLLSNLRGSLAERLLDCFSSYRIDAGLVTWDTGREELVEADVGVDLAELAIADSGTLLLTSRSEAEKLSSTLPLLHLVLVPRDRLVEDLEEAASHLEERAREEGNTAVSLITGPSRTADIEGTQILGVHGPNWLYALILREGLL